MTPLSIARRILWSAAAALFGVLLFSLAALDHVPAFVSAFLLALAALAAWRPAPGLALTIVLVPVATWIGRTWDGSIAWPEAVAVAFLLGYSVRQAGWRHSTSADALILAINVTIAIVSASIGVQFLVLQGTIGSDAFLELAHQLAAGGYFVGNSGLEGLDAAMRLIEGLLLAHAGASVVRSDTSTATRLIAAFVIGAAAAGALNVWRVWTGASRLDAPVAAFFQYLLTLRYNVHYEDVNAAGSYFVMALLPALAFIRTRPVWRWIVPAALIVISLSLSGSRAALLGGVLGAGIVWLVIRYLRRDTSRSLTPRTAVLAAAVMAFVGVTIAFAFVQRDVVPASTALQIRVEFARISVDMLSSRPLFGVGIGQFPDRLSEFSTPELEALYPVERENAHNNFLQILAELGIAGLAAVLTVLGIGAVRMLTLLRSHSTGLVERATYAGLLAFVLTWFSGHPLLVDPPALTFWAMFGVIAGLGAPRTTVVPGTPQPGNPVRRNRGHWAAAAAVVAVLASIPLRAQHELGSGYFEHLAIGVSPDWRHDDEVAYRGAGQKFELFLQTGRVLDVPMRATVGDATVLLEIRLHDRLIDRVQLSPNEWRRIRIVLPASDRAFERVQFHIDAPAPASGEMVRVGKAVDLGPAF
ncbi:MAG TPA: O-antigen ligase family protein [Vicinamibacterales bacterium]